MSNSERGMTVAAQRWWDNLSPRERLAVGCAGGAVVLATGGAFAYAIASGGLILETGTALLAVGNAARILAKRGRG